MSGQQNAFEDAVSKSVPSQYVKSISDLEKGAEFLKALGDFVVDFPSDVKSQAKEVSKSILDLMKKVKGVDKDSISGISDLGIFLDSLFRKYMESVITTKEAATICTVASVVLDKLNEQMTPGMGKAVYGSISKGKVWKRCDSCGFVVPTYPGRYPKFCPECGEHLTQPESSVVGESKVDEEELDKYITEYNTAFKATLERSNIDKAGKVALFKGTRKIFDGYAVKAIDFLKDVLKSQAKKEGVVEQVVVERVASSDLQGILVSLESAIVKVGSEKDLKQFIGKVPQDTQAFQEKYGDKIWYMVRGELPDWATNVKKMSDIKEDVIIEDTDYLEKMIKNIMDGGTYLVSYKAVKSCAGKLPKGVIAWQGKDKDSWFISKREKPPAGTRVDAAIPMDKKFEEQVNESGVNITRKMFDWFEDHADLKDIGKTLTQFSQQFGIKDMKVVNDLHAQYLANNMNWEQVVEAVLKVSVALVDKETTDTGKAKVIASDITLKEFDALAKKMGYERKVKDNTLAGYYLVNKEGDALVTYPPFHKKGSVIDQNEQINEQGMTPGMQTAFDKIKYKGQCPSCGMLIPKYRGRYPKHCTDCGYDLEQVLSSGAGVKSMTCPRCACEGFGGKCGRCGFSSLEVEESLSYDSAVVEVFHLLNNSHINEDNQEKQIEKLTESCKRFGVEFRGIEIADSLLGNSNIPAIVENVLVYKFGDADKSVVVANIKKYSENLEADIGALQEFSKLDDATLCAISPLLVEFDELTDSKVCEGLYDRFVEIYPEFYSALNVMRAKNLSLSQKDHEEISAFMTEMYDRSLTPIDLYEKATPEYYEGVAKKVLSEEILGNLRVEVLKRTDLHRNIRKLLPENMDFNKAVLAFSSCLSRVVKENDLRRVPSLNVFRSLTYEKMGNLFEGKKVSAVNFLKGVFLSPEDRK